MKKNLIKIFTLGIISSFTLTSCNLDVEEKTYINDFGTITGYTDPLTYAVTTDNDGEVISHKTTVSIKNEDVNKRVYMSYNILPSTSSTIKYAEINSMRPIYKESVIYQSYYDSLNETDQDKHYGATPIEFISVEHIHNYMNIVYHTLSNNSQTSVGLPILIYDDINSTDSIKKFTWQFKAEGDAHSSVVDYCTFEIGGIMTPGNKYEVEVSYKSLPSGKINVAKYTVDLSKK